MHYYRLQVTENAEEANKAWSGVRTTITDEKPPMMTEAARKLPVPSWWQGKTTLSEAQMVVERVRGGS